MNLVLHKHVKHVGVSFRVISNYVFLGEFLAFQTERPLFLHEDLAIGGAAWKTDFAGFKV